MKKILFCICSMLTCMGIFAQQQPVVAVAPFEAISGINATDANVMTRVFNNRLGNTNTIILVDRSVIERVIREHRFQISDWSNHQKTAELGEALNADWIVRGEIEKLGSDIIVTVAFYDIKTFQFKGGADIRFTNINEVYDKIDPLVDRLLQTIGGTHRIINTARSIFEKGITYYKSYEFDRAIFEMTDAIKVDTSFTEAYFFRGHSYYMRNITTMFPDRADIDASINDFTMAINLDPYNAEYYFNRGMAYRRGGPIDKAIEDFDQAIRLDPYNAMYYTERGSLYYAMYYPTGIDWAIADYSRAIRIAPNYVQAYNKRAQAYLNKSDYSRAIADYNKIIDLYPYSNHNNLFSNSGILYSNNYLRNAEFYKGEAYYLRGYAWEQLGNRANANNDYAMATELGYFPK